MAPDKTANIATAVVEALKKYRQTINDADDLRAVTIQVKMKKGTDETRTTIVNLELESDTP